MTDRLLAPNPKASRGQLTAHISLAQKNTLAAGSHVIPLPTGSREALLYVPRDLAEDSDVPLIVSLHGAGGDARHGVDLLRDGADKHKFAVLSPASRAQTWDVIVGGYGPDVGAIDTCLSYAFTGLRVRSDALAISGFSDGASYALSIGLINGNLFPNILAFSPGFFAGGQPQAKPRVFISHGTADAVLPVERCSQAIVPRLRRAGYLVEYREFEGPHTVPSAIKEDGVRWWLKLDRMASLPIGSGF